MTGVYGIWEGSQRGWRVAMGEHSYVASCRPGGILRECSQTSPLTRNAEDSTAYYYKANKANFESLIRTKIIFGSISALFLEWSHRQAKNKEEKKSNNWGLSGSPKREGRREHVHGDKFKATSCSRFLHRKTNRSEFPAV